MLKAMREGAKSGISKIFLFSFLIMAVGGLVFMDIGGFFRGGVSRGAVAKIGRDDLGAAEFDRIVRRTLGRQGISPADAYRLGLVNRILNTAISSSLLRKASWDMGINVSDDIIARQINTYVAPYINKDMSKREALRRMFMSQGMNESEFVKAVRDEMSNAILRNALQLGTAVTPPQEARDLYQYKNETRAIEYILLKNDAITDYTKAPEEALMALYTARQEYYAIPESRTFTMMVLSEEVFENDMELSEEDINAFYEDNIATFELPERRILQQSIINTEASARNIVEKMEKGKSLKEAVEDETGNDDAYLGENTFEQEGLLEDIAEAAFAAEKNATIGPVQTAMGWHVLYLTDILEPGTQPYEEVKKGLRKEMLQDLLADRMFDMANSIDDRLAGGEEMEDIAAGLSIKTQTYGPLYFDGSTADKKDGLKDYEADRVYILETVFELLEAETAPVLEMTDGRFVVLRTDTTILKSYKPYGDVRDTLEQVWIFDQKEAENKFRARAIVRKLQDGEIKLAAVAKEHKVKLQTLKTIKRTGTPPEPLTSGAKEQFFESYKGGFILAPVIDGLVVGQVTDIQLPVSEEITDEDLQTVIENTAKGTQAEFTQIYLNHLHQKYGVTINDKLLLSMYGPGNEQF